MKKYIFTLIAVLLLSSMAHGVASNRVYYHIDILDQWGEKITSVTQIDIQNESGSAVAVYSTKSGTTEVGSTGVITTNIDDGSIEFFYADTAIDITVTDGTRTYEIESFAVTDHRFMLPSFLTATSALTLTQTQDLDFSYASWIIDGDTTNRLDAIPDNDGGIFAIGDASTQADFYWYSTSAKYLFMDEGGSLMDLVYLNIDLDDNSLLRLGSQNDVTVQFDGTNFEIFSITQNVPLAIGDATNGFDFTYSFETAGSFRSDYNADFINLTDDMELRLGTGTSSDGDFKISSNGSAVLQIEQVSLDTGTIEIGVDNRDIPIKWYGETASSYFQLTGDDVNIEAMNLALGDGDEILLGDALGTGCFTLSATSSVLTLNNVSADTGTMIIGASDHDMPIKWWGEAAGAFFNLTGDDMNLEQMNIALGDGDAILLGDALGTGAFTISSTSAVLTIAQVSADTGTIVIGVTGGTDIPITWYGETSGADFILTGDTILIDGLDMTFEDTDVLKFGDAGADGTIQSDGTNIDFVITASLTLGDGGTSHYTSIAADGEITLTGTACVTKNHQLPIATGGGTVTVSALTGAPSIDFNADGEIVYASFQVPNDWDAASDMTIVMMVKNEIAETDGDDIEFVCTVKGVADGEAHTDAGQTVTIALDLTGGDEGQNYVNKCTGTIDYNEGSHPIAAGDTVIIKAVVSLGAGTEPTGPLHIIDWWIEYTANKLGTAT